MKNATWRHLTSYDVTMHHDSIWRVMNEVKLMSKQPISHDGFWRLMVSRFQMTSRWRQFSYICQMTSSMSNDIWYHPDVIYRHSVRFDVIEYLTSLRYEVYEVMTLYYAPMTNDVTINDIVQKFFITYSAVMNHIKDTRIMASIY